MPAAITITLLAALCVAGVFVVLLATRRPAEGWGGWLRETFAAWRGRELTWVDADVDDVDEVGGLGTLFQLSEPGSGYALPPEDLEERLEERFGAVIRHRDQPPSQRSPRTRAARTHRPSHANH